MSLGTDPLPWTGTELASLLEPKNEEGVALKDWAQKRPWLTLSHLLNHTSGIAPWCWFGRMLWQFQDGPQGRRSSGRVGDLVQDKDGEKARIAQMQLTRYILEQSPLQQQPSQTIYSDLNYYLLARVIENLAMSPFRGWQDCIDELNKKWSSDFWHASLDPERSSSAVPFFPYLNSQVVAHIYESRKLENHAGEFGSVHDTNANILASEFKAAHRVNPLVSSHAGIFGSIRDLANAIPFFIESQLELDQHKKTFAGQSDRFSWGLDTPTSAASTAGLKDWPLVNGRSVFGHLGFTGTSMWMADDGQFHVLLTNRTAHRRTLGAQTAPRILFFQESSATAPEAWLRFPQGKNGQKESKASSWQSIPARDAYTLCFEQFRLNTRYWDRNTLRTPPDLAHLRRTAGRSLWAH
jgi:CubicO group peptidase (beta-lactamase class C family)